MSGLTSSYMHSSDSQPSTFTSYCQLPSSRHLPPSSKQRLASLMPSSRWAVLSLVSFVLWKLDTRNKQLIKNAENGLRYVEEHLGLRDKSGQPRPTAVFLRDAEYVERQPQRGHRTHWS